VHLDAFLSQIREYWTPTGRTSPAGRAFWERVLAAAQERARASISRRWSSRFGGEAPATDDVAAKVRERILSKSPDAFLPEELPGIEYSMEWFLKNFLAAVTWRIVRELVRAPLRQQARATRPVRVAVRRVPPPSARSERYYALGTVKHLVPPATLEPVLDDIAFLLEALRAHGASRDLNAGTGKSRSHFSQRVGKARRRVAALVLGYVGSEGVAAVAKAKLEAAALILDRKGGAA
jgi:hypothetical protein